MDFLMTEAVTHLGYDPEPPTVFELADDLLDPRTSCDTIVRIRKGNETYRITRVNIIEATGELERVKPEALEVGDIIHIDPYDLEITHIRLDKGIRGEPEYVLSTVHYFFVWPVESVMRVRADNHLLRKKGSH